MLQFSTKFPIQNSYDIEDMIKISIEWIIKSPHNEIRKIDYKPEINDEYHTKTKNEQVSILKYLCSEYSIGGIRFSNKEKNILWTTDVVFYKTKEKHVISIQVNCESDNMETYLPPAHKPYIIRKIMEKYKGANDGDFVVSDKPIFICDNNYNNIVKCMNNESDNMMPIIYVSIYNDNKNYAIDCIKLSEWLSGMAHIIVETERSYSFRLKNDTKSQNAYNGAMGVYFPNSGRRKIFRIEYYDDDKDKFIEYIAHSIQEYLTTQRFDDAYTIQYLKEIKYKEKMKILEKQLSQTSKDELRLYIDSFDSEIKNKEEELKISREQIHKLTSQLRALEFKNTSESGQPLIVKGDEDDLYDQEQKDIVINIMKDKLSVINSESRIKTIIESLLKKNISVNKSKEIEDRLKHIFNNYTTLDKVKRSELIHMGFSITEDGSHYKLIFKNDSRYTFPLSKTSSDGRSGKNMVSVIRNKLFL